MKKQFFTLLFVSAASLTFAQEANKEVSSNPSGLEPIVYTSAAQKEEQCGPRIEVLKAQLAKEGISEEAKATLTDLLWRFENAIVVEEK